MFFTKDKVSEEFTCQFSVGSSFCFNHDPRCFQLREKVTQSSIICAEVCMLINPSQPRQQSAWFIIGISDISVLILGNLIVPQLSRFKKGSRMNGLKMIELKSRLQFVSFVIVLISGFINRRITTIHVPVINMIFIIRDGGSEPLF